MIFRGCKGSDALSLKMVESEWDSKAVESKAAETLCGDLTSWIPLVKTFKAPRHVNRKSRSRSRQPKVSAVSEFAFNLT